MSKNIEFLDADPDFDVDYLNKLNEQVNQSFAVGSFVTGQEIAIDHERRVQVEDQSTGAHKLDVHVGAHT